MLIFRQLFDPQSSTYSYRLGKRADELAKDRPIVTVCRAGARSAQAATILRKAGFDKVANLAGGMLRWRSHSLPTQGARD